MWHSFDFFYQSWPSPIKSVSVIRVVHSLCYRKRTVHSIWSMVSSTLQSMSDGNGLSGTIFFKHRQIRPCPQESGYFENGAILSVFFKKSAHGDIVYTNHSRPGGMGVKVSPKKSVVQSACQYDVTPVSTTSRLASVSVHRRAG